METEKCAPLTTGGAMAKEDQADRRGSVSPTSRPEKEGQCVACDGRYEQGDGSSNGGRCERVEPILNNKLNAAGLRQHEELLLQGMESTRMWAIVEATRVRCQGERCTRTFRGTWARECE